MNHTSLPWTNNGGRIEAANAGTSAAEVVAVVGTINQQTFRDTANARYIIRAVNDRAKLLKALETVRETASQILARAYAS